MALVRISSGLDPMQALLNLQRALEQPVSPPALDLGVSDRGVFPPVNVFREPEGYVIRLELPGLQPEHLKIEGQGRSLTISGTREVPAPEGGSFHRRERSSGQFARSLRLPADSDGERAAAVYKHGMLTIRIPRHEEAQPRQITIRTA
jgi:HSP20 family protein